MIHRNRRLFLLCTMLILAAPELFAQAGEESVRPIGTWLKLGPIAQAAPAFGEQANPSDGLPARADWPRAGAQPLRWPGGHGLRWEQVLTSAKSIPLGPEGEESMPAREAWLASYVDVDRFTQGTLEMRSGAALALWLDGAETSTKSEKKGVHSAQLTLSTGKHFLLMRCWKPAGKGLWELGADLSISAGDREPQFSVDPERGLRLEDLIDVEQVSGLSVSPDGVHLAIRWESPTVPAPHAQRWLELRRTEDGALVRTTRGSGNLGGFAWAPDGQSFAFVERSGGKSTLWVEELGTAARRAVLHDAEDMGALSWKPDGEGFVVSFSEPAKEEKRGVHLLRGLTDRWPGKRDRSHLWELSLDGVRRRLTAGEQGCGLLDIAPDGSRYLVSRSFQDLPPRALSETEVVEIDAATLAVKPVFRSPWFRSAMYGPKGERLLLLAGPSAFEGVGRDVPEGVTANDYDVQAFVLTLANGSIDPITKDYDPSVQWADWSTKTDTILMRVSDRSRVKHAEWSPETRAFRDLASPDAVVASSNQGGSILAWVGADVVDPPTVRVLDRESGAVRALLEPAADALQHLKRGRVEPWIADLEGGSKMDGYIVLPPDFDPRKRYPCIVNFYGGTSPVSRTYGGRYPKSWWASHGYVVYVMQPSGATGFGQEFSARHVNNWGRITIDEILASVRSFLDAHRYVDRSKVGCIGASYGGFTTMLLLSHTDLFASGVSHAGISSIASYWGEGWWGAHYSAVATADKYPWNAKDLYVEQSALFRADQIKTPLLLIHGTADTNVPIGESDQLYVALKLLEREVEYLRVEGENHHILSYDKRKLWMRSIVAWFDRTLKGEPGWWDHLYEGKG